MKSGKSQLNNFKPASPDFEFQQYPFYWLMRAGNAYSLRMEKSLKKGKINITAWRILMILREVGKLSVSDIARHAVAKTPTITRATYKLRDEGYLKIFTSEDDGRVSIVELTDQGKEAIETVIENSQKLFDNIYENFSYSEIEVLNKTLQKLFMNLDYS
jgi:DNA-binding MarR family transcriptional regulator